MKSLQTLWQELAQDLGELCGTSTTRDLVTVARRVESEGLSFLTITLPSFAKDLEKGLERGSVDSSLFTGFRSRGGLPLFLGGFLRQIFDARSGTLLDTPSSDAIYAVRQLSLLFSKVNMPCSPARVDAAFDAYIQCEQDLKELDSSWPDDLLSDYRRVSFLLFADVLTTMDKFIHDGDLTPKHGPGATADKLRGNEKYSQTKWPSRLDSVFSYQEYALPNFRYHQMVDRVEFLEPRDEIPVKVITVPKTLKTPRIIAEEPTAMQYMQQAILERFVPTLESSVLLGGRSHIQGMLGFTDQSPNQRLARSGSSDRTLATLDLSEASDRVSNQLVIEMMRPFPWISSAVQATRSTRANVNGEVVRLSKFASMGSALTFPIEAMVFLTSVMIGIEKAQGTRLTRRTIQSLRGSVRVYGDDIIVPVEYVSCVISSLEAFGFKVNNGKSFWGGSFRESCGGDYYDGDDVSVVKCRALLPTSRTDVSEIISTVSLRNQLYKAGNWRTARHLDQLLARLLGQFPTVGSDSPALGRHTFLEIQGEKMCHELHRPLVRGYGVVGKLPKNEVDGPDALLKWFLKRGDEPFADKDHLERSGRPKRLALKLGWYPAS